MQTKAQQIPEVHPCHVCDSRGGCLGAQLVDDRDIQRKLFQARRIQHKGEHVFREAETADAFFVVRSGSVKSYLVTEDGEDQVLGFYLPGDVFGLDGDREQRRASSAVALETTSLCRFPHAYLGEGADGANLIRIAAEQMQRDHNLVLILARKDADGRIASLLDDLAGRYRARGYSGSAFVLSMSRQDIGCYLGLAVETVSRTLTRFQECGILRVNRREVEILDHAALSRLAGARASGGGAAAGGGEPTLAAAC